MASMLFNLDFANNTVLSHFFFFLNYWPRLLIPAVITQIFNPVAELIIPIGILTKKGKAEIEMHPAIIEAKIK